MPRINLLPWREADRKQRQKEFLTAMAAAFLVGVLSVMATIWVYSMKIENQQDRNARLENEITELEKSITEIDNLERQKERLLARMAIIEQLQRSRPEIVHLFDEVTRRLPEGVYLTGVKQTGSLVEVKGVAQSSTRVSTLMRQSDESEWMSDPAVIKVETTDTGPSRQAEFTVTLKQISQSDEDALDPDEVEDAG